MAKGKFIVLEGIDVSGKTTQIDFLSKHIRSLSKYANVLTTYEPWRSEEIKRKLTEDRDAYSDGEQMTKLYIEDRVNHQERLIFPNLKQGVNVLCDRFSLSLYAYQGTQGVSIEKIKAIEAGRIMKSDLTFFLDVDFEVAKQRIIQRGEGLEKFEGNEEFTKNLINNYRELASRENIFGKVIRIDGNSSEEKVAGDIGTKFDDFFGECYL